MTALANWKEEYRRSLKAIETEEPLDLLVYRPLAFLVAKALVHTPATANMVSVASLFCGVLTGVLFWQGTQASLVLGAATYFLCNTLDCADGQIARMKGSSSPLGYIVDGAIDYLATIAVYIGVAHMLATREPEHATLWWAICTAWICSYGWQCAILDRKRHEWAAQVYGKRPDPKKEIADFQALGARLKAEGGNFSGRALVWLYLFNKETWARFIPLPQYDAGISPSQWSAVHRLPLRMSVMMGSTMQMTFIMLAAVLDVFPLYFYACLSIGNLWAIAITVLESRATKQLALERTR